MQCWKVHQEKAIGEKGIGFKSVFLSLLIIIFIATVIKFASTRHLVATVVLATLSPSGLSRILLFSTYKGFKSDKVKPVKEQLGNVHLEVFWFYRQSSVFLIKEHC